MRAQGDFEMLHQTQVTAAKRINDSRKAGAVIIPRTNWLVALGGERIRTIFDASAPASPLG